jgi:hypothetical protein
MTLHILEFARYVKLIFFDYRYALLMNGLLASFYVTIGSFNGLVTFIGTIYMT